MGSSTDRGFTLLELLIAMSMLAVVLTTLYGSYRSILDRSPWIEKDIQSQEMAQTCLNQMLADLNAVYVISASEYKPPLSSDPPSPYCLIAENHWVGKKNFPQLGFSSLFHLRLGHRQQQDIVHVVYYGQQLPDGSFVLRRSETFFPYPLFQENPADPVLCKDIRTLSYTFYDSKGNAYQTWNSDSIDHGRQTPSAMHISLELEPKHGAVLKMETGLVFPASRSGAVREN